ncbi:MAG: LytR/AlgR family response regulator transcription factor, partial [Saprospiraceae bacterium]
MSAIPYNSTASLIASPSPVITPLKCIIVEDEPLAAEILAEYVNQTPFLELTHVCFDAIKALDVVRQNPVDVMFLDINLPKLNGLEFL